MEDDKKRYTLAILVNNRSGVLMRVVGLFSQPENQPHNNRCYRRQAGCRSDTETGGEACRCNQGLRDDRQRVPAEGACHAQDQGYREDEDSDS